MTDQPERWERLPRESGPAYAAFDIYLREGSARSITKVARECHKSRGLVGRWSSRHNWRVRAIAWDAFVAAELRAEILDANRTLARRHLSVAHEALAKVGAAVAVVEPESLTVTELTRLWATAHRVESEVLAVPFRVEVSGRSGPGGVSDLTDEQVLSRLIGARNELNSRIAERQEATCPDPAP